MVILTIFLALTSAFMGVTNVQQQKALEQQIKTTAYLVDQCGDEWINKPVTNEDLIRFGILKIDLPIKKGREERGGRK
jgi:hypothetical protein